MRKSRYTEKQIVGILKESEAGLETAELCRKHGISDKTFYRLEGEVRWAGSERSAAASSTGRREPQAQAAGSRTGFGHRRIQGGAIKKVVSPQARREAVAVFRTATDCWNGMPVGGWKCCELCCATVGGRRALPKPTVVCAFACGTWQKIDAAGAIVGYMFCCSGKA